MSWTQKHDIRIEKNERWVLWGKKGVLNALDRPLDIKHQLKESARRYRKLVSLRQQIRPELGTKM